MTKFEKFLDSLPENRITKRIEMFYDDGIDLVFALYEDSNGNVHYKVCNADMDAEIVQKEQFYKKFQRIGD